MHLRLMLMHSSFHQTLIPLIIPVLLHFPFTFFNLGFSLFAAGLAFLVELAKIAAARSGETFSFFAIFPATAENPG